MPGGARWCSFKTAVAPSWAHLVREAALRAIEGAYVGQSRRGVETDNTPHISASRVRRSGQDLCDCPCASAHVDPDADQLRFFRVR